MITFSLSYVNRFFEKQKRGQPVEAAAPFAFSPIYITAFLLLAFRCRARTTVEAIDAQSATIDELHTNTDILDKQLVNYRDLSVAKRAYQAI